MNYDQSQCVLALVFVLLDMKQLWTFVIVFLLLAGCGVRVRTAYEPKVDFGKYKNFCWLKNCEFNFSGPTYFNDSLVRQYMQQAIIAEMAAKGINYNSDHPDLLMDVNVLVENDTAFAYHHDDALYFRPFVKPEEIPMLKGTMVIDLVDQKTSKMVWRSVAVSYMDIHPELTEANFRKGVAKALKNFPPRKSK